MAKTAIPSEYQSKIKVIFDGIDQELFAEATPESRICSMVLRGTSSEEVMIKADDVLLTYATRGMEPLRGFQSLCAPLLMQCSTYHI